MESPLRKADTTGVKLIETLLWDGAAFARLPLHLARLQAGARAFGWGCPQDQVMAGLQGAVSAMPVRVRLTLDGVGGIVVETAPLPPFRPVWRIGLAGVRLASDDPWLAVKSTRRAAYDAGRAGLPDGLDEVIFANEHGEVCDGTITTLFFDRGEGLCTPPLHCGLLPGVLRAEMLASGVCRVAVLMASDLPHVQLWVGNALRGLTQARWTVTK